MIGAVTASAVAAASFAGVWIGGAMLPWPGPHDWLAPGAWWSLPGRPDAVALTFDDGPAF